MLMPSLSQEEPSLDSVYEWYTLQESALKLYKKSAMEGKVVQFYGMSRIVVQQHFVKLQRELDLVACLAIHAAAEAALMVDFFVRSRCGVKGLNKEIKIFLDTSCKDTRLDLSQALAKWKELLGVCDAELNSWNMHRSCRHWLAHGRYYSCPMVKKGYDPTYIYDICKRALSCLEKQVPGRVTYWKK